MIIVKLKTKGDEKKIKDVERNNFSDKERAILVALKGTHHIESAGVNSLEELYNLANAAGACAECAVIQDAKRLDPAFFLRSGKLQEVKNLLQRGNQNLIIFDENLSPAQQRNLEDYLGTKVVDRTSLILDIFAQRARSREGKIQVELAQLSYLLPRLRGKGPDLSRLGGGIGTRGPGETKLEIDKRKIKERMLNLKKHLEKIKKTRNTQRHSRRYYSQNSAVLIGYTNAGKSTLLNRLTNAGVPAEDRLFSTLDTTVRKIRLSGGNVILLSDTVGFISKLPHQLIAAFKATLEEINYAALLIHVIDMSSPCIEKQVESVNKVLKELAIYNKDTLYVMNKIDCLESRGIIRLWQGRLEPSIAISAKTGEGVDKLYGYLDKWILKNKPRVYIKLPLSEGQTLAKIFNLGTVTYKEYQGNNILLEAYVDCSLANNLKKFSIPPFKKAGVTTHPHR